MNDPAIPIYTIGYGAREIEELIAALQAHQIAYLVDVRSQPYSRYKPDFNKEALATRLPQSGIRYLFLGDALGGRPDDPAVYNDEGKVDYDAYRRQPGYLAGIDRLKEAWRQQLPIALLCSEGKPENCHRSMLIGASLRQEGLDVAHIDENGELLSQQQVEMRRYGHQPSLFGPEFHKPTSRKRYQPDPGDEDEDGA